MTSDPYLESHEARHQARATLRQHIEQAVAATSLVNADAAAVSMGLEYAVDAVAREASSDLTARNLIYVQCVRALHSGGALREVAEQSAGLDTCGHWATVRAQRFSVAFHALSAHLVAP